MKIAFLGDIGLLGAYSLTSNPQIIEYLEEISKYLQNFDLIIGNLETPFTYKKKTWGAKSAYICTDPVNIDILKALHINAVTVANNHMFDFGKEGFETTISLLEKNGIAWFGANGQDFKYEFNNNKLIFNGFCCYSTNPLKISSQYGEYGINRFNVEEVLKLLKENHRDGFLNVIAVHSGIEHVNRPSIDQIKISHIFGDAVPYLWHGHHPHVIQGIEKYKNALIAHSLGNFCFAGNSPDKNRPMIELSDNNRMGMILTTDIINNKIIDYNPLLINIGQDGHINIIKEDSKIKEFSNYIENALSDKEHYINARKKQREIYLGTRKELRDFKWVLKRLRPRYARLLLDNHINAKKYKENVTAFL